MQKKLQKRQVFFSILISTVLVLSFGIPGYAYVTYGNVHGTIMDNFGNPLENVEIRTYNSLDELVDTDYTYSDGFFRLLLDKGSYTVRCVKDGYVSYEASIYLPSGSYSYNVKSDPVDMGEIEMSHTLIVDYQILSRVKAPGETVLFPFTVTNIGEVVEIPQFTVEGPEGWESRVIDSSGEIRQVQFGPGTMSFSVEVQIPDEYFETSTVTLSVLGYTTQKYNFTVIPVASPENSIKLTTEFPSISVKQGESPSFTVSLSNSGLLAEILSLRGVLPVGWEAVFKVGHTEIQSINLGKDETQTISVEVTLTEDTSPGVYQIGLQAVSGEAVRDNITLEVNIKERDYDVRLQSVYSEVTVETGNVITFPVTVSNLGDLDSLFILSVLTGPEGWNTDFMSGTVEVSNIHIASGGSVSLTAEITPSSSSSEESYTIVIQAESSDSTTSDTLNLTVNLMEPSSEVEISSVYPEITVTTGSSITYPLRVWNKGSVDTQVSLSVETVPSSWDTTFTSEGVEASSFLLEAGTLSTVNLAVVPPRSVEIGDYVIKVRVETSEGAVEDIYLNASIVASFDINLELSTLYKTVTIGEKVSFVAIVHNPGNSPLTTLYVKLETPNGWDLKISPSQVTSLGPRESAPFDIEIETPADTIAGDYLISTQAVSDQGESGKFDLRVTAQTSNTWGYIGYGVAALFLVAMGFAYRRFKRR